MKFFVTTPIYYVNNHPHIGSAYSTLAADTLARFHRQIGDQVLFLTGTDEHGAKIAEAAAKVKQSPQTFVDTIADDYRSLWNKLDISYDRFIRTTEKVHVEVVRDFLNRLKRAGYVYPGQYSGLYCRGCESFKRNDELIDGKCPDHGTVPETVTEDTYFFKLSIFKDRLIKIIANDQLAIKPEVRKNEVLSFLENNDLEDLSISRQSVGWGIPLPWDESHTIYVWVDALINYYTAGKKTGFWPPTQQILAKDILRFHAVIWPAMLLAINEELPKNLFVHGYITSEGKKMSKSIGNVVFPEEVAKKYSVDGLRYYLFNAFTFGEDGDFSDRLLNQTYNAALSNELGNLVQRVIVMVDKYYDGLVPAPSSAHNAALVTEIWQKWQQSLSSYNINVAFESTWQLVKLANQRIDETRPWGLVKEDQEQLKNVLYELLETLRHLSLMLTPLLPDAAGRIRRSLNLEPVYQQTDKEHFRSIQWGELRSNTRVSLSPEVLFPRHQ